MFESWLVWLRECLDSDWICNWLSANKFIGEHLIILVDGDSRGSNKIELIQHLFILTSVAVTLGEDLVMEQYSDFVYRSRSLACCWDSLHAMFKYNNGYLFDYYFNFKKHALESHLCCNVYCGIIQYTNHSESCSYFSTIIQGLELLETL